MAFFYFLEDLDIANYADDTTIQTVEEKIDGSFIESNRKKILLGITIDRDLKFYEHVNNLC